MPRMLAYTWLLWGAAALLILALCLWLSRKRRCGLPGMTACAVAQYLLCYFVTAEGNLLSVDLMTSDSPYSRGAVTLYGAPLMTLLLVCVLLWTACTLLSGIRGRAKQPAAPASGAPPHA